MNFDLNFLFDKTKRKKIDQCLEDLYKKYKGHEDVINKEFNKIFFSNIPQDIIKQISLNLPLEDLENLCQTSKVFNNLCQGSDSYNAYFWEQIIKKENDPYILNKAISSSLNNVTKALIKSGQIDVNFGDTIIGDEYDSPPCLSYSYEIEPPLMLAINDSNIYLVKLLLENKANPNVKITDFSLYSPLRNTMYNTPILSATYYENVDIVKLLLQFNADINEIITGTNPLSIAINNEDINMINFLLKNNAKIQYLDIDPKESLSFISKLIKDTKDTKDKPLLKKYEEIRSLIKRLSPKAKKN